MISTQYALCSKRIIQDSQENVMSLIDIFEEINSPGFPLLLPRLSVIWVLERETSDQDTSQGSIAFLANNQLMQEFPIEINFQGTTRTRCILVIGGMTIERPGTVSISFRIDGTEKALYKFAVKAHVQQMNAEAHPA